VVEIEPSSDADLIYSDEDCIDDQETRQDPHFKSDWNPELFLGCDFICRLGAFRRSLLESIGGIRSGFEGAEIYDLAAQGG